MNTADFLRLVWPTQGYYLILIPATYTDAAGNTKNYFKHFAYTDVDHAAAAALGWSNNIGNHDVYFAMASVGEDLTRMNKAQRNALGKKVRGKHKSSGIDNTFAVRSFWVDLDVGQEKPGHPAYPDQAAAARHLVQFVQAMGLPRPFVSSSGGGLHAYWPMTEDIHPETWQQYASILKQLTESWGLKADPSRTADRASILRPVGTNNWKTGIARPVQLVVQGQVTDTQQLLAHIQALGDKFDLRPAQQYQTQSALNIAGVSPVAPGAALINDAAIAGVGYEAPPAREIVRACKQLAWQLTNQGMVSEPLWYAMIGCMRHTKDGRRAVHVMSQQSPNYDVIATDAKIDQSEAGGFPPTLCQTFENLNPGGCTGCPMFGKIKTPLQAVRKLEQVAPPSVQLLTATGAQQVMLPPPPDPFKRVVSPVTSTAQIAVTTSDKNGVTFDEVVYEYDIYPSRMIFDERANRYAVVVNRWLPKDGWKEFEVPTGAFYDKRNLSKTLGDLGVLPDLAMVDLLVQYMIGYMRTLQAAAAASTVYAKLGWRDDPTSPGFVLPDCIVTPTSVDPITPSRNVVNSLEWKPAKGSLDEWKKIAAVYERPGMEAHQFGFGVGFASPLFQFTNFRGMIVSMVGQRGAGKSSSALTANSIWGHPRMGWADRQGDTLNSFWNKLGVLNNLPATYDEHTNLTGEVVSDLCYMVSKGQGRGRLSANGEAQENHGGWNLMMLMTGNTSLNSRLATAKADASAEAARIFEFTVPSNTMTKAEADQYWGPAGAILDNYGLAGVVYAQQLLASEAWARQRIGEWVRKVDVAASVSSGERFWSAGVACVLTGFELSNACGLTNADVDRLFTWACNVIRDMRDTTDENTWSPVGVITSFLNNNLRNTLVVDTGANSSTPHIIHAPSDRLHVRMERHTNKLYIDRATFRKYCGEAKIDAHALSKELMAMGVLLKRDEAIVLGRLTPYKTSQSKCWLIDLGHPAVGGVGDLSAMPGGPAPALKAVP